MIVMAIKKSVHRILETCRGTSSRYNQFTFPQWKKVFCKEILARALVIGTALMRRQELIPHFRLLLFIKTFSVCYHSRQDQMKAQWKKKHLSVFPFSNIGLRWLVYLIGNLSELIFFGSLVFLSPCLCYRGLFWDLHIVLVQEDTIVSINRPLKNNHCIITILDFLCAVSKKMRILIKF